MFDMLKFILVTWCWLVTHCIMGAHTGSLQMVEDNKGNLNITTPEMIAKYGYPIERHSVQTEDGYILELHRIPHGKSEANSSGERPPVLIHHALLCSSFDWVVMGPKKSLGFILADEGFDVWLANARGNTYSRKHISLDPSDAKFWEYSWHEMGTYDVPAEIDHILSTTGQEKLFYIGHSMGTTMFFVMMSQKPQYNEKIILMSGFAPVAFFTPSKNPVFHFIETVSEGILERMLSAIGINEFLPQNTILNPISTFACKESAFTQRFCLSFIFSIVGKSSQVDKKKVALMLAHTPAGASTRQVLHFAQLALSGEFQQFDFGEEKNMEVYGQTVPPVYDIRKVTTPVALYYSDNDKLAPYYNVKLIASVLPKVKSKFRVPLKAFNHLDFMWGSGANVLLYKEVIRLMKTEKETS
ncbi:lipase 1-like isoform X2 [Periplaneta americana]